MGTRFFLLFPPSSRSAMAPVKRGKPAEQDVFIEEELDRETPRSVAENRLEELLGVRMNALLISTPGSIWFSKL